MTTTGVFVCEKLEKQCYEVYFSMVNIDYKISMIQRIICNGVHFSEFGTFVGELQEGVERNRVHNLKLVG